MYYFTPDTIAKANEQISELDAKVGGLLCILHCLTENIEENVSYVINGDSLRNQLSFVFDKEPKSFENENSSYIIFARNWVNSFFKRVIKNKIDLLACSIFFLRRYGFEREYTEEEVIDTFIKRFNLQQYREHWFFDSQTVTLAYNQSNMEDNQTGFYLKMNYTGDFKSILFKGVLQTSATKLKAAGQIQTLYSGSGIQYCFLLSDESLDQYYIMGNSEKNAMKMKRLDMYKELFPHNRILFGAPGTGKSHTLEEDRKELLYNDREADETKLDLSQYGSYERVTFHPDYSYAHFVGTYKPVPKGEEISYEYVAGPFIRTLVKALQSGRTENPKPYLLIIEEINRANAAAVFGDVFQLLDRKDGASEYAIQTSRELREYLAKPENLGGNPDDYAEIRIPDNMFIWATMNSADQGVYPMDTAFKRRWDFKYIDINEGQSVIEDENVGVKGQTVNWNKLRIAINNLLENDYGVNEDKLMGPFFITPAALRDDLFEDAFKNKVLMYLCEDVLRHRGGEKLFDIDMKHLSYAKVCNAFDKKGIDIFVSAVRNAEGVIVSKDNDKAGAAE